MPTLFAEHEVLTELETMPYLPGMTFGDFAEICRTQHPVLYDRLDFLRISSSEFSRLLVELGAMSAHFESKEVGGRGEAYRQGQNRNPLLRARGIQKLFDLLKEPEESFSPSDVVVDVLGGNGTLTRAMTKLNSPHTTPTIITSDAASSMVHDALLQCLPAIREPAHFLLLKNRSVDKTIFAYGTHHIAPGDRVGAFMEAWRILKPGGRIVVQDFEEGTPTARWYSDLLDRYTLTGHKCEHFTPEGMKALVQEAGFEEVKVQYVYDPFVVTGDDPTEACRGLAEHVCSLFGLEKLLVPPEQRDEKFWQKVHEVLRPYGTFLPTDLPRGVDAVSQPTVAYIRGKYVVEFPRVALVATGKKDV
ncbi:MAG TPA: methyltransferase domain-containing protein [Candidatus Angelobacter sp.]|nr:methyltransferase domain-containing protein [Candidatus Angelobacter sp.]